ncbi:MAG: type II secretion system protein [Armatimonadota bacterium]|jgi:general secretion pathway protein G
MVTIGWIGRRRRGFTLLEVLIVITVIAILSMLVIPRAMAARRTAKEAQLRGNLKQIRDAIERFEGTTAAWPPSVSDVMAANGAAISGDFDGQGGQVDRTDYDGPYIVTGDGTLPKDPFTGASDWNYDNTTGAVHSSSGLSALDGSPYSQW